MKNRCLMNCPQIPRKITYKVDGLAMKIKFLYLLFLIFPFFGYGECQLLCKAHYEIEKPFPQNIDIFLVEHQGYQCAYFTNPCDMKEYPYCIQSLSFEMAIQIFYFYNLYYPLDESKYKSIYAIWSP